MANTCNSKKYSRCNRCGQDEAGFDQRSYSDYSSSEIRCAQFPHEEQRILASNAKYLFSGKSWLKKLT